MWCYLGSIDDPWQDIAQAAKNLIEGDAPMVIKEQRVDKPFVIELKVVMMTDEEVVAIPEM